MKAETHFVNGKNHFKVYFSYEDYYGGEIFNSFDDMQKNGTPYPPEGRKGTLVGWLYSYYWGGNPERISILPLNMRPNASQVKAFMRRCLASVNANAKKITGETLKTLRLNPIMI